MESSDSNESESNEEQMSQNTNSNSASVTVTGPTGVTGPYVIKFGYKEFTVKAVLFSNEVKVTRYCT